jgi:hypothetical protein
MAGTVAARMSALSWMALGLTATAALVFAVTKRQRRIWPLSPSWQHSPGGLIGFEEIQERPEPPAGSCSSEH